MSREPEVKPQVQSADWIALHSPMAAGGTVDALAISASNSNRLYTLLEDPRGASFAVRWLYRSDDAALSWQPVYTFTAPAAALAVDPANAAVVYAGAPDALFRSVDSGLSWTQVYTVGAVFAVVSSTLIYAGGQIAPADSGCSSGYLGVARSEDSGYTWRMVSLGCAYNLTVMAVHPDRPDTVYVGGSLSGGKGALFERSPDGGQTWQPLTLPNDRWGMQSLLIDPQNPDRLYAENFSRVDRSADGGDTWTSVTALPSDWYALAAAQGSVYAVPYKGGASPIYRSEDGGVTWWASLSQLPCGGSVLAADAAQAGVVYASPSGYGIFKSENGGGAWQERNVGIRTVASVKALAVTSSAPGLIYAGNDLPRGGLFYSADSGVSWETVLTDTSILAVAVNPLTPSVAYAGSSAGIYETADGPSQWWGSPGLQVNDLAVSIQDPSFVYAAVQDGTVEGYVKRRFPLSDFSGPYWQTYPIAGSRGIATVAVDPRNPAVVYAGGREKIGSVYRSLDAGLHWQTVFTEAIWSLNDLAINPLQPDTVYAGSSVNGVYRSLNGGDSWEHWSAGLGWPGLSIYALAVDALGIPYVGTGDGVYRWEGAQGKWVAYGLPGQRVQALVVQEGAARALLAGTATGILKKDLPAMQRVWLPLCRR